MEPKFKRGDMIVPVNSNAISKDAYIIEDIRPENTYSFDIYLVRVPNAINKHSNVLEKSVRWVDKKYRLVSKTEKVLYGT